jgi:cardiolipin synthase
MDKTKAKRFLYSRVIIIFSFILIQLLIYFLFIYKFRTNIEFFLGGRLGIPLGFMIYLSNTHGKNEYKFSWLLPFLIFPLFGIAVYILFHFDFGGRKLRKQLILVKEKTKDFPKKTGDLDKAYEQYPEIKDLCFYLSTYGNFHPFIDNAVTYYPAGEKFFPDFTEELSKAKHFIFMEFFIIKQDESWNKILNILQKKSKEGVEIRLLCDGFGSAMSVSNNYLKHLKKHGIDAKFFLPLIPVFSTYMNFRNHRKIVVIDGKVSFTGGINISNQYFNYGKNRFEYWKDNAIKITGDAVASLTALFLQDWNLRPDSSTVVDNYDYYLIQLNTKQIENNTDKLVSVKNGLIIPYGDDAFNELDIAEDVYSYLIEDAKKYLHITSPYVLIDENLMEALIFAKRRGVEVSIIVPSVPDHYVTFCIGRTYIKKLMDAGINVYLFQHGFIHAKTFICDDKIATVGTINLDYRSLFHHFECGCVIYKNKTIQDIEKDFQDTIQKSVLLDKENYKKISKLQKAVGHVCKIFAPMM